MTEIPQNKTRRNAIFMKIEEKISAGKIRSRVDELAAQISKDYEGKSLLILVLANGGIFFGVDLLRKIAVPAEVECVRISSYKNGTTSSGTPEIFGNLQPENFRGNDVLIVDDIIDTGTTLRKIRDQIENFGARSVKISAFLSKRSRRKIEIEADYVGFEIEDCFAVGYGLDFAGKFRKLPVIGKIVVPET